MLFFGAEQDTWILAVQIETSDSPLSPPNAGSE